MDTTVTRLEGNAATISITVPAEVVDAAIAEAYRSAGADRSFAGFRKGHAPRSVLDTNIGRETILTEASSAVSKQACGDAIVAEELLLIAEPAIMLSEPVVEGEPYTFSAKLELRPELTLTGFDNLVVKVPPLTISDDEITDALEQFRQGLGTFEVVSGEAVGPKDMIITSLTSEIEGMENSRQESGTQPYELGRGAMPPGFDEGLIGHVAGDAIHLEIVLPGSAASAEEEDKKVIFDVVIHEVRAKRLPELTDESVTMFGFTDLADMREQFSARLQAERDRLYDRAKHMGARRELASRLEGDVPALMVNARVSDMLRSFSQELERYKMSFEQYCQRNSIDPQEFFTNMRSGAEQDIKENLALEALFRALGLEITDEYAEKTFAEMAETAGATESDVEQQRQMYEGPMRAQMRLALRARMASDWLLENIVLETVELGAKLEAEKPVEAKAKPKPRRKKAAKPAEPDTTSLEA